MHLILFVIGVLLAAAGVLTMRLAFPIEDVAAAGILISSVVALVGGVILVGVSAAVRSLHRIAERLDIQPLPLPPVAAVSHEDPAPRPVRPPPAPGASGASPTRPSLLGWFGRGTPSPAGPTRAPQVRATAEAASAQPVAPPTAAPVDLGPLARMPDQPIAAPSPPAAAPPSPPPPPASASSPPSSGAPPVRPAQRPAPASNGATSPAVYRSGVIDGMAYTLFMDGSIEAELPQGRVKFATVEDLQRYLLGNR